MARSEMSMMMTKTIIRTYSELIRMPTFRERFEYLRLGAKIGEATFGFDRWINQGFYRSREWKKIRDQVIMRDNGCDLAIEDRVIYDRIEIHHINPINVEDIEDGNEILLDLENLVCCSPMTHKAIHYGDASLLTRSEPNIRRPNDTCPWKK